jgi:hypothetical protein
MNLTAFLLHLRSFTNFTDPTVQTDDQLKGWLFMAEANISGVLRIADMVQIDTATITQHRVAAPADFIAGDFIHSLDDDTLSFDFVPREQFYRDGQPSGQYCQSGNFLMFGGTIGDSDPAQIELHYFGDVPHLTTSATWLSGRYNGLLTAATLAVAFAAMEQLDTAMTWQSEASGQVTGLNDRYKASVASASRLKRKIRGFG